MLLHFFYTMVQKSQKRPKTQIKGVLPLIEKIRSRSRASHAIKCPDYVLLSKFALIFFRWKLGHSKNYMLASLRVLKKRVNINEGWPVVDLVHNLLPWPKKKIVTAEIFMTYRCAVQSCDIVRYQLWWFDATLVSRLLASRRCTNRSQYRTISHHRAAYLYVMNISAVTIFLAMVVVFRYILVICASECSFFFAPQQAWSFFIWSINGSASPHIGCLSVTLPRLLWNNNLQPLWCLGMKRIQSPGTSVT